MRDLESFLFSSISPIYVFSKGVFSVEATFEPLGEPAASGNVSSTVPVPLNGLLVTKPCNPVGLSSGCANILDAASSALYPASGWFALNLKLFLLAGVPLTIGSKSWAGNSGFFSLNVKLFLLAGVPLIIGSRFSVEPFG